jgi:hypothetical protein
MLIGSMVLRTRNVCSQLAQMNVEALPDAAKRPTSAPT